MIRRLRHQRRPAALVPPRTRSAHLALIHRGGGEGGGVVGGGARVPVEVAGAAQGRLHSALMHFVLPDISFHAV